MYLQRICLALLVIEETVLRLVFVGRREAGAMRTGKVLSLFTLSVIKSFGSQ